MAFEGLSEKLNAAFKRLRGKGRLTEHDVREAMREVRLALLEADVSYKVVKEFVATVTERSVGTDVLDSLTPAQQVVKIVNEELTNLMGGGTAKLAFANNGPTIVMMVGLQGAGKTTTLRSVVGILQFDAGEITIGGKSIRTDPIACKRELAYIPDNPDLYDYMTGIRYLNFIADIFGVSAEVRGQRIHDYAARFELTDDLAQPIAAYSHGMKQKLAIISAWLHQPRLIIMDEPFVGLDPKASHLLKGMMREFCDAGGAIFFSTHVLEVAEKLCDKVAIIRGGKLIRSGTMEEVKGDDSLEEVFLELEGESC